MIEIQNILCPVDFFPASFRAAGYAIALAKNYDAKLHLLHVVSPVPYTAESYVFNISEIIDALETQAALEMKKLAKKARAAGIRFQTEIRVGDVRHGIEAAMDLVSADLLVMGTHGRRGIEKWFLGSVTEGLLRRSPIPMLTIRGTKKPSTRPPSLRRILVTTDFSEGTDIALAYAFSLAQESQARVTLLHVLNDQAADLLDAVRLRLEKMIPDQVRDWSDPQARVDRGNPFRVILDILNTEKIDLLVMNIHGKGMLDRALLGSTAERVVRAAECPVLLIPPMRAARPVPRESAA
jgi:nucleotide-binding universal stress UspA family protein